MARVAQLTHGASVGSSEVYSHLLRAIANVNVADIALLQNNAEVGAKIAVAFSEMTSPITTNGFKPNASRVASTILSPSAVLSAELDQSIALRSSSELLVIGAAAVDITARAETPQITSTTSPGTISLSPGGVARNIAEAAHRLGEQDVLLIAPVASDAFANVLHSSLNGMGMRGDGLLLQDSKSSNRTAFCNIVLDNSGALVGGVADMSLVESVDATQVRELCCRLQ